MVEYKDEVIIELNINEEKHKVKVRPSDILIDTIREKLGLTGAKAGCKNGDCGTCTILVDGWPVKSCLMLSVEAVGHKIQTIEGLHSTLQEKFIQSGAFQCGYCTSGFLMVATSLKMQEPDADEYTIEDWLSSNICRCTDYSEIRQAVKEYLEEKP